MKILAIEEDVPGAAAEQIHARLEAEAHAVWGLRMDDVLREIWFTPDHRAVLMLEIENEAAARDALARLPLFRDGLIGFSIIPLLPYDGFGRLFKKEL